MEQFSHKMKLLLRFPEPLEQEFRRAHDKASEDQVRWIFTSLWLMVALTFPGDIIMGGDFAKELLLFRFGVTVPGMLLIFSLTYTRWYSGNVQLFAFVYAAFGVTNYIQPLRLWPVEVAQTYHSASAAGLFFLYALFRMRFWWASAAGTFNVAVYLGLLVRYQDLTDLMLYNNVAALLTFNLVGIAVAYVLERNWRESFLLTYRLQRSESRSRALLASSPDALIEVDETGVVYDSSPAVASFFTEKELEGGITKLWPGDSKLVFTAIEEAHLFDVIQPIEAQIQKGEQVRIHELRFKKFDKNRALIVVRDITARKEDERREAEQAFLTQQRHKLESLGVMAGGITHDFNSLLTVMLGQTELLLNKSKDSEQDELLRIRDAIGKASELTEKMLAYAGKTRLKARTNDIGVLVEGMKELLQASTHSRASLSFEVAPDLPNVLVDRVQVEQVLVNFVTNAAEACTERGKIKVEVGTQTIAASDFSDIRTSAQLEEGEYVYLSVSDDGKGMSNETIQRIFEPFYSTKFQGRGMGLASVLGIMSAHQGGVMIQTELEEGTTMKAVFPVSSVETSQEISKSVLSEETTWQGSGTVLLADDDENVTQVSKLMLESIGFDVIVATGGNEAVRLYDKHHQEVRFVLLDMTMPDLGGEAVIEKIQSRYPEAQIVINTAYAQVHLNELIRDQSVVAGIIHKPYTLAELKSGLIKILEIEE